MGRYQAYPEYKDSGVEWLGNIPTSWKVLPIKYLAKAVATGGTPKNEISFSEEQEIPWFTPGDFQNELVILHASKNVTHDSYKNNDIKLYPANSVLVIGIGATIGKVSFCPNNFSCNQQINVIIPNKIISSKYLTYALCVQVDQMRQLANFTTIGIMNQEKTKLIQISIPVLDEQEKIANFLDHETAKIDTLIEQQQQLIQLLKEKRQAVISHAVTKGLSSLNGGPNAPMKDSGVEWLGEVPVHWVVCAIKYVLSSQNSRRIPLSSEDRGMRSGDFRYYGASGVIDYIDDFIFDDESNVLVGEDGANLVSRNTPLAFSAHGQYWVNNHAHILKPKDSLADYWAEVIEHIDVTPIVTGSAQPKLTAEALNNLIIAFPKALDERVAIDQFIKLVKSKYQNLIEKAQQQIALMQERRTALISAAVTGKIDVRHFVSKDGQAPQQ